MANPSQPIPIALGDDYFGALHVPITAKRVFTEDSGAPSHPHDLTEVEHCHDFSELVLVLNGMARHHLDGDDFPVAAGDVFLLQGGQRHFFYQRQHLELINVMFDPRHIELPESSLRKLPGYCAIFLLEPQFRGQHRFASRLHLRPVPLARAELLASEIEREATEQAAGYDVALTNRLLDLILFLSRIYDQTDTTEAHELLRIGTVISALESDFERNWRLDELLDIAHMSRSNFMRVFKRATSQAPMEYLNRLRIRHAMKLLRDSPLGITDIAFQSGFSDSNYFARYFKKSTGTSPSVYRKRRKRHHVPTPPDQSPPGG